MTNPPSLFWSGRVVLFPVLGRGGCSTCHPRGRRMKGVTSCVEESECCERVIVAQGVSRSVTDRLLGNPFRRWSRPQFALIFGAEPQILQSGGVILRVLSSEWPSC